MPQLSKSKLMAFRQCPRRLWLTVRKPGAAADDTFAQSKLATGIQLGEIAREQFPRGVLVCDGPLDKALDETSSLLQNNNKPLFEAAFSADDVLIRADILIPGRGGKARMIEVKSSGSLKPHHPDDAAIQAWVAKRAGLKLQKVEIAHIDTSFIYSGKGDYDGLLKTVDITDEVETRQAEVSKWVRGAKAVLKKDEPIVEVGPHCEKPYSCPFYDYCAPAPDASEVTYPPEILPHNRGLANALRAEGYDDIRDIPEGRLEKPVHIRVRRATINEQPELDPAANSILKQLPYPRYYTDFESIAPAIPIWAKSRPYQQIPFQWSCHIETKPGGRLLHREYLADGTEDPRRGFAESLADVLDEKGPGPVIVYHAPFEKGRMAEMAKLYRDLAPGLEAAIGRVFDLLPLVREHYYHPDMHGSWSIKKVLPTIAPDLAYDGMEVGDGGMAQEAFAEIMDTQSSRKRKSQLRQALLDYCERDTLAMVRIAQFIQKGS